MNKLKPILQPFLNERLQKLPRFARPILWIAVPGAAFLGMIWWLGRQPRRKAKKNRKY